MPRVVSVVWAFVAVVLEAGVAAPALAQDAPVIEPGIEPGVEPPPVAQQAAPPATVFEQPGVDLGARLGYGLPFGNAAGESKLSDGVSGVVPLVLEIGYRLTANVTIGALFQYGVMQIKEGGPFDCGGIDCSGSVVRLGAQAIYNFNLAEPLTPWLGIGTGYEWFTISASQGGQSASAGARGMEFLTLHAGGDYRVTPQIAVGPFASLSLAQYATVSMEGTGLPSMSMDISDKEMHQWLQLGVRGRLGL